MATAEMVFPAMLHAVDLPDARSISLAVRHDRRTTWLPSFFRAGAVFERADARTQRCAHPIARLRRRFG
jgi:hypothetical protein